MKALNYKQTIPVWNTLKRNNFNTVYSILEFSDQ
jgi:hypothetical protein